MGSRCGNIKYVPFQEDWPPRENNLGGPYWERKLNKIGVHAQFRQILNNGSLEFFLLFGRIGIIKAHNDSSTVTTSIKVIQQDCLGMSNVQISRWFWWKSCHNTTR